MPDARTLRQPLYAWLVLLVGLAISFYSANKLKHELEAGAIDGYSFAADQITLRIEERLSSYALVLRSGAALFDGSEEVTREEWRHFTDTLRISETLASVQGIGIAILIRPEELATHTEMIRAEGFPEYRVWPEGEREVYSSVVYLEPFRDRNLRAFGYDMLSEPMRRAAMDRARDTGRATLSGRLELVQETGVDVQPGTLMYVPIYHTGVPRETIEQRRAALYAWSYSPYRMYDLMQGILDDWEGLQHVAVGIRVYDGQIGKQHLLYSSFQQEAYTYSAFAQYREIDFNGTRWKLAFDPLQGDAGISYLSAWFSLVGGILLSTLLFALLFNMANTQRRALGIAEQLTTTIREREVELSHLLERLKTITSRIPGMVYEYRLYPDGRVSFPYASEGVRLIYGFSPEALREDASPVFKAIHPEDREGVAASIQASARDLSLWRHEYRTRLPDGRVRWVKGESNPHREADGSTLWYGMITDITASKEAELVLRTIHEENQRFREALDHVSSYIYMKDRESRYIYANRACLDLFDVTPGTLPGSDDSRFFSPATTQRLRDIDRQVLHGEHTSEEVETVNVFGQRRVYLEIKTPIFDQDGSDRIVGLLGISTDITAIKEHERQLEHIAHYDALTNLPNRVLLADRLQQSMVQAQRRGQQLAVVFLDLDGFKAINDHHGHVAGDKLLINVSAHMQQVLREGDTLSRIGGDEFVAVLLDLADVNACAPMLTRLLDAASHPLMIGNEAVQVSASLGVAFYPQIEPVEAEQLLRQADQAMYQAKLAGKGRYHVFDAEHDRSVRSHHETLEHIAAALTADEFVLYFQPKVNMRSGAVIGAEALVRWQHPQRGLLPPSEFLPIIEDHALAIELGEWVIRTALTQIARWQEQGQMIPVSVNIGALQLRLNDFPERLQAMLAAEPGVSPAALELEVLETSALGDLVQVSMLLERCRVLGVNVSLDDFGTGYSSLTYLKRLPAGVVKVDQSFVRDILADPEDLAILDGILSLASAFNRKVIAEGVETIQHGDLLLRIGCELAQGYGIARPMPASAFLVWAHTWQPPGHWSRLRRLSREALPLLYAGIELSAWVDTLVNMLQEDGVERPLFEPHECRIGGWLERSGYHGEPGFGQIDMLHRQIHQLASELCEQHESGERQAALDGIETVYALRDRLLAKLNAYID